MKITKQGKNSELIVARGKNGKWLASLSVQKGILKGKKSLYPELTRVYMDGRYYVWLQRSAMERCGMPKGWNGVSRLATSVKFKEFPKVLAFVWERKWDNQYSVTEAFTGLAISYGHSSPRAAKTCAIKRLREHKDDWIKHLREPNSRYNPIIVDSLVDSYFA